MSYPTFLDLALTFMAVAIILLLLSHWDLGAQFSTGLLVSGILVILIQNAGDPSNPKPGTLAYIEKNTLGKLGPSAGQSAPIKSTGGL